MKLSDLKIPSSELTDTGAISPQWTLWVEIPHSTKCLVDPHLTFDPYEQVGCYQLQRLATRYGEAWGSDVQEVVYDLLNVFNTRWGQDQYIEGARKIMSLKLLLQVISECLFLEASPLEGEVDHVQALQHLLELHQHCSQEVSLRMVWGW